MARSRLIETLARCVSILCIMTLITVIFVRRTKGNTALIVGRVSPLLLWYIIDV